MLNVVRFNILFPYNHEIKEAKLLARNFPVYAKETLGDFWYRIILKAPGLLLF